MGPANMFDAATRQICTVKPSFTSTPLHALTTLNDPTWVEASRALAQKLLEDPKASADQRLAEAFRRSISRAPQPFELKILCRSLTRALKAFESSPKSAQQFLAVGDSPRDPNVDVVEHAAYTSVCLAIFNLDEALSRE